VGSIPLRASIICRSKSVRKVTKLAAASLLSQLSVIEKLCEPDQPVRRPAEPAGARDDAHVAGHCRVGLVVEEGRPAAPVEVERHRPGGEAHAGVVPQVVGHPRRHRARVVEVHEELERLDAGLGVEGGAHLLVEELPAVRHEELVEAARDRLVLADELEAVEVRRVREEQRLVADLVPGLGRGERIAVLGLEGGGPLRVLVERALVEEVRHVRVRGQLHEASVHRRVLEQERRELGQGLLGMISRRSV
jgi:hypothetical protein